MQALAVWSAMAGGAICATVAVVAVERMGGVEAAVAALQGTAKPVKALTAPESPVKSAPAPVESAKPKPLVAGAPAFDIVRVEPSGETVVAGHAAPHAAVELRDGARTLATIVADDSGQFAMVPDALPPGEHSLQLVARADGGAELKSDIAPMKVEAAVPIKPAPKPVATIKAVAPIATPTAAAASPKPTPSPSAFATAATAKPSPTPTAVVALAPPPPVPPAPIPSLAAMPDAPAPSAAPASASVRPSPVPTAVAAVAPAPSAAPASASVRPSPVPTAVTALAPPPAVPPAPAPSAAPVSAGLRPSPIPTAVAALAPAPPVTPSPVAEPAPAAAASTEGLRIAAAKPNDAGGFEASGGAQPGAKIILRLNGSYLAEVVADALGRWSLTVEHGLTAGFYALRAETLDSAGKSTGSTNATFAYAPRQVASPSETPAPAPAPSAIAAAPAPAPVATPEPKPVAPAATETATPVIASAQAPPAVADPSHAVVEEIRTATVVKGDNLWDLARHYYGDGLRYSDIFRANATQIHNPSLIYIGQVFVVPQAQPKPP